MQGKRQGCGLILAFQSKLQKVATEYRHLSLRSELEESGKCTHGRGSHRPAEFSAKSDDCVICFLATVFNG